LLTLAGVQTLVWQSSKRKEGRRSNFSLTVPNSLWHSQTKIVAPVFAL